MKHCSQSRLTSTPNTIPCRDGEPDHRQIYKAGNDSWKCSFSTSGHDDYINIFLKKSLHRGEDPMYPCHTDVILHVDFAAHLLCHDLCLFGYQYV